MGDNLNSDMILNPLLVRAVSMAPKSWYLDVKLITQPRNKYLPSKNDARAPELAPTK
eukprot:CAMPEP_0196804130 /NCGR_PEP_ID=MMETSP1362-20130617/3649_1 /TAXON_ID=163516 /ORGANISM="Leptocylindrus danicus, Strain CCMP1856" /LENGTH=56 /DNA_ID=CAMNT_0042176171 /DNA_START=27 /DNA_END=194 /DNA_ORIENTATION=+